MYRLDRLVANLTRLLAHSEDTALTAPVSGISGGETPIQADANARDVLRSLGPLSLLPRIGLNLLDANWCEAPSWLRENRTGVMVDARVFDTAYERAMLDMVAALEYAQAEFWPIEGTLISLLRYGRMPGMLSNEKVDVVDKDIEFMIRADTESFFEVIILRMLFRLQSHGGSQRWTCLDGPKVLSKVFWPEAHPQQQSFENDYYSCSMRLPLDPFRQILVQLRRYISDDVRGGIYLQRICEMADSCNVVADIAATKSFPGGIVPFSMLLPFRRCEAYGRTVPCPRDSRGLLALWEGRSYEREDASCFALPRFTHERNPLDSRNHYLSKQGLDAKDVAVLRQRAHDLHQCGFGSFFSDHAPGGCATIAAESGVGSRELLPSTEQGKRLCKFVATEPLTAFATTARSLLCIELRPRWRRDQRGTYREYLQRFGRHGDCSSSHWMQTASVQSMRQIFTHAVRATTQGIGGVDGGVLNRLEDVPRTPSFQYLLRHSPDVALTGFLLACMEACEGTRRADLLASRRLWAAKDEYTAKLLRWLAGLGLPGRAIRIVMQDAEQLPRAYRLAVAIDLASRVLGEGGCLRLQA